MIRKTKFLFLTLLLGIALFASDVNALHNEYELPGGTDTSPGSTGSIIIGKPRCVLQVETTLTLPCAGDLITHKRKNLSTKELGESRKVDRK